MGPVRRIAAIVLPQLACELVRQRGAISPSGKAPLAVILGEEGAQGADLSTAVIDLVDDEARRYGVRPGQRVVEAAALVAHLAVHRVTFGEIDAALGRVAEVALGLGATAAIRLGAAAAPEERSAWGKGPFDTVWLDITGAAHLVGGEEALCDELGERVAGLGHRARIAIADGPRLAQALARWSAYAPGAEPAGAAHYPIAAHGAGAQAIAPLPVQALPIDPEVASFLVRLGLLRVGDVAKLPRAAAAARLGPRAAEVVALMSGHDPAPLAPFEAPRQLEEEARFEDPVESAESLLFVLRGMTSRVSARLAARGEACGRLDVAITYDRSIARLRREDAAPGAQPEDEVEAEGLRFQIDLPAPLSDGADLLRPLKARLERTELGAPAVGLRLTAASIAPARQVQLDLSRDRTADPDSLPTLLAELSAEIGADRVGVLEVVDAHRPEARSRLVPVDAARAARAAQERGPGEIAAAEGPARLLPRPVPLGRVGRGAIVAIDRHMYAIERMRFVMRLDGVEWWTASPASRDYVRAWLASGSPLGKPPREGASPSSSGEAWIYVDRATGEAFLQGWCE
ncbi:MAG: DNA polymerase Y family protein [Polyangiaceae bacterium]|nr:DNA polymerase Y family protein [Polyangiaceae bacterium]